MDKQLRLSRQKEIDKFKNGSKTQQHFVAKNDIRNIMKRLNPESNNPIDDKYLKKGFFMDATKAENFHDAMNKVLDAKRKFNQLPARIRAVFKNNIQNMLNFVQGVQTGEPAVINHAVDCGLIDKKYRRKTQKEIVHELVDQKYTEKVNLDNAKPVKSGEGKQTE